MGVRAVISWILVAAALCVAPGSAPAASVFTAVGPVTPTVDAPRSVAFTPSGEFLAAAGAAGPLSRFALTQGGSLAPLATSSACSGSSVAFKPVGNILASADAQTSTVSLCSVSRTDGSITPLGSALPTGTTPTSVQFSPDGKLLATVDYNAGTVSMFTVGATALAPVNEGEGFFVDFETTSATFSPDGRWLVVTSGCPIRHTILVFAVAADGTLTQTQATDPPDGCARDVAFDPSGDTLAVLSSDRYSPFAGNVTSYRMSAAGQLVQTQSSVAAGTAPSEIAFSPDGKLAVYTSYQSDTVTLMRKSASGKLVPVMTLPAGDGPSSVTFSADGTLLAVSTSDDDRVALFRLAPGPVLLPAGSPADLSADANGLAIATGGRIAVSTFLPDGLKMYTLDSAGKLTPGATLGPSAIVDPHSVALSPNGQLLAVGSGDHTLSTYDLAGGAPVRADTGTTGSIPIRVAFSPDGSLVATANFYDDSVSLFSVKVNGALTPRGTMPTSDGPISIAFSPDGTLLLTADQGSGSGQVSVFSVSGTTLVPRPPIATGGYPQSLAFRPGGGQFALVDFVNHSLETFTITAGGAAALIDEATVGTPERVAYSPSGDLIAVAGDPGELRVLSVSAAGGLTPFGDVTTIDGFPTGLAFDPTGRFILIPQSHDRNLWVYPLAAPTIDTVVVSGPGEFDRAASPAFAFDASYPSTYECKLDAGAFGACARSATIPVATDGPHTLAVRASDALGNADPTPATHSWTSDRAAPSPPSPQSPADHQPSLPATVALTWAPSTDVTSGVSGYDLVVDGTLRATVAPGACAATCSVPVGPLADGGHAWLVRATDVAGNRSESVQRSFMVDAAPPAAFALGAPADGARVGDAAPTFSWVPAADVSGLEHQELWIDGAQAGGVLSAAASSARAPAALADGDHRWKVVAVDPLGNRRDSDERHVVVDTTAPTAVLQVGPARTTPGIVVTFDAGASRDPGGSITRYEFDLDGDGSYEVDGGTGSSTRASYATVGTRTASVRVTDSVGRQAVAQAVVAIVDRMGSSVTGQIAGLETVPKGVRFTNRLRIDLQLITPPFASAARISNGGDLNDATDVTRVTVLGNARVRVNDWPLVAPADPRGQSETISVVYEVGPDTIYRTLTVTVDLVRPNLKAAVLAGRRIRVKASDPHGSGVRFVRTRRGHRAASAFKRLVNARLSTPRGRGKLEVQVRDQAGNRSKWRPVRR